MARRLDTPTQRLLSEARTIEELVSDIDPPPRDVEAYWELSADLIVLVTDIEALTLATPAVEMEDPLFKVLRSRLTSLESRVLELSSRAEEFRG
jgi:class 3 adenylate cyclase